MTTEDQSRPVQPAQDGNNAEIAERFAWVLEALKAPTNDSVLLYKTVVQAQIDLEAVREDLDKAVNGVVMPPKVLTALREVIDYFEPDEEKSWQEFGEPEAGHIWCSIKPVRDWLKATEQGEAA
jgi:hypothetical protein